MVDTRGREIVSPFVTLQTGEQPDDRFFDRGKIIVTTYDQLLSGLLDGPYGLSDRLHNINAATVAGSLVVFDEFHLMEPQRAFLTAASTPAIMDEVREALSRPKFAMRMNTLNTSVGELMESLLSIVEIVPDTWIERVIEHDPEDDKILACALASRAQWIVSGDEHLLSLKRYRGIPILAPKAFWDRWSKARR